MNLQPITVPWNHYIIDNFLSTNILEELIKLKDSPNFVYVDDVSGVNKTALPIHKNLKLTEAIQNDVVRQIGPLLPSRYFCLPDLVKCDPGYKYNLHKDHPDKKISIVVYLWPEMCNATILVDEEKQHHFVGWKQNRALIFKQEEHGLHYYTNMTEHSRLTLNIYITDDSALTFKVLKVIK